MKMFYKKDNCLVEVYKIFEDQTALIFSPSTAGRQNGNGWEKIKIKQLIPEEYYNTCNNSFISKNTRSEIKKRLILTQAIWTCTDGISFNNCNEAVEHEYAIMKIMTNNDK